MLEAQLTILESSHMLLPFRHANEEMGTILLNLLEYLDGRNMGLFFVFGLFCFEE